MSGNRVRAAGLHQPLKTPEPHSASTVWGISKIYLSATTASLEKHKKPKNGNQSVFPQVLETSARNLAFQSLDKNVEDSKKIKENRPLVVCGRYVIKMWGPAFCFEVLGKCY